MVIISENIMMRSATVTEVNALNSAFVPVTASLTLTGSRALSCCNQHSEPVHVISQIPQPYFCPGPYLTNAAQDQRSGQHRLYPENMLNEKGDALKKVNT